MASGGTNTSKGGYDFEFVTAPPKSLECPVCLLTLRDPHVISCCGNEFCQRCIERVQRDRKPCPLCNEATFTTLLHKKLIREVNALVVRCPQKELGCEWKGELGQVQKHLNPGAGQDMGKGCGFVMVACSNGCGAELPRHMISQHEAEICPKRPIEMQIASLMQKFETVVTENQLLRKELGEIKRIHQEELDGLKQRCDELEKKNDRVNMDLIEMTAQYASLKTNTVPLTFPPVYMMIDNFKHLKSYSLAWFSDPFYSHPGGYKMVVIASPQGSGTHMSLYVQLRRGEFDDQLQWPFNGQITIEAYNWTTCQWSASVTINLTKAEGQGYVNRPKMFRNGSTGYDRYISNADLDHHYLNVVGRDCLSLRVSSIKLLD